MSERIRWFEKAPGNTSAMRIIAMICAVTGCIAVIFGGVLIWTGHAEGAQLAVVGGGMAGLGEVAKAWQAKGENK